MSEQIAHRDLNEERIKFFKSQNNLAADIFTCRNLVVTSMDMLVDMRNNGNDVITKREMAIDCLDSAIAKLNDMLEKYE
jgi:hypothetical protein